MENYLTIIVKKFADWAKLKVEIHLNNNPHQVYFKERQIWWASVGQNIGVESNGKNVNFERPVIILKKFNGQAFLAVVLSTKQKSGDYYFQLTTNLEKATFVNLSQIKLMSSKRLIRRIGEVSISDLEAVKEKIKNYL